MFYLVPIPVIDVKPTCDLYIARFFHQLRRPINSSGTVYTQKRQQSLCSFMKTQLMEIANNVKFKKQVMTTTFGTKRQIFLTDPKCKIIY